MTRDGNERLAGRPNAMVRRLLLAQVGLLVVTGAPALPQATSSRLQRRAAEVRRLPDAQGFTVLVSSPFVVIGDEGAENVRLRAERTVRWAVLHLKRLYFRRDPNRVIDVWLCKDDASYRRQARRITGREPSTPFGFFSPSHDALIMNIATGGGTLVHEIVHAFVEVNFPACPTWFNEGLGSLYEQSDERDGRIVGLPNWRLPALQEAIRAGRAPRLAHLVAMSNEAFRGYGSGLNYAAARYLLLYLQQKGLLVRFYRAFARDARTDPTGEHALRATLNVRDFAATQRDWERWTLGLKYP